MVTRNLGLKTRDIKKAGEFSLKRGNLSFSSAATIADRWKPFASYMTENNIKDLKDLSREDLIGYGVLLSDRVCDDEISVPYAQNLVSAVNTVMKMATLGAWHSVSPTLDCGFRSART